MAMSSITVSGITPDLSILGQYQQFKYTDSSSSFRLFNDFAPLVGTPSQTLFEYRNHALSGFRWIHTTTSIDTIGQLKLQSFVGASPTGTDIISFNNDGTITFLAPIKIPTVINVSGPSQMFLYDAIGGAEIIIQNLYINSNARLSLYTDTGYKASFGYDYSSNTYIDSDIPIDVIITDTIRFTFNETNFDLHNNSIINGIWDGNVINVSKGGTGQTTLTNNALLVGNGISAINQIIPGNTGTVLIGNTGGTPSFSSNPTVSSISITNAPINSTDGVNKSYVDALYAGIEFKQACYAATTVNLPATYTPGSNPTDPGINATLTSTSFGTFTVDGLTPTTSKRILIKNQANTTWNGVYTVFNVGGPAAFWVLRRATDFDQPGEINPGVLVPVEFGNTNAVSSWIETGTVNTVGADAINFTAFTYSPDAFLEVALNLSDLANITTARSNLGLTNIAIQNVTTNSVLVGAASNTINSISLNTGQILIGSTGNPPVTSTATYPLTINAKELLYGSASNVISGLTTAPNSVLISDSLNSPVWVTSLPVTNGGTGIASTTEYGVICGGTTSSGNFQNVGSTGISGQVLTSNGPSFLPSWQNVPIISGAYGSMWFQSNVISSASTSFVIITGTTTAGSYLNNFTHTNKRLTYNGSSTVRVYVTVYVKTKFSNTGNTHTYIIAKNGTTFNESQVETSPSLSTYNPISLFFNTIVQITTNDYIEVYMKTSGGTIIPEDLIVTVAQI